jgi:hypothetical protein
MPNGNGTQFRLEARLYCTLTDLRAATQRPPPTEIPTNWAQGRGRGLSPRIGSQ